MPTKKVTEKLVSPARQLAQQASDLEQQRGGAAYRGVPEFVPGDVQTAGPAPTLYNVNTGEWDEVTPLEARLHNIEIGGPAGPNPAEVWGRMWQPGATELGAPPFGWDQTSRT